MFVYVHGYHVPHFALCSDENRARMKREYLADPQYNFETVNHASTACGPLVQWAIAQVCTAWACNATLARCLTLLALSGANMAAEMLGA